MNFFQIKIVFAERDHDSYNALRKHFGDSFNVEVLRCEISQISQADCVVYPSNSYGLFDDNLGKSLDFILNNISSRVRHVIDNVYYGEQPVGSCFLLDTHSSKFKFFAHVPVTRFYHHTLPHYPYYAFRALLSTVLNHNKVSDQPITSIICSSFALTNNNDSDSLLSPDEVARQMRLAYGFVDLNIACNLNNARMINDFL